MKQYDAIVIGAGNGGLAAAAKLLSSGKSCLVCEKHNLPGGFATSFVRGRFEFEASLHEFNGIGSPENPGSARKLFRELGVEDKIEWLQLKDAFHLISKEEGYRFTMPFGLEAFTEATEKLCPGRKVYVERLFSLGLQIRNALDYLSASKGKPDPNILKEKYPDYLSCGSYSVSEGFDAMGFPQIIKDICSAYWCYLGAHCDDLSFLHYVNMLYSYISGGAAIPKYRSHELSLAFETRIRELGGDIWYNAEVINILTDATGHVSGVRLKDGTEIKTRHVVANCSPHVVYGQLMNPAAVPERALKLTNARKFAGRGFTVFLGLDRSPDDLGIKEHNYFIYDTCDSVRQYHSMEKLQDNVVQATVCLNRADPDCSPMGTTILYMTTLYTEDVWSTVTSEDYYKVKNQATASMIDRFEKSTGTSIRDHIEEIAVATPVTYARYCGHPQGTIYGYESQYRDGLMPRIMMVEEDHFVPGLRIGGGYGERLLGFPSSYKSGFNEAVRTLHDMEKDGE